MKEKIIKISDLCEFRQANGNMNLNKYFNLYLKESNEYLLKKDKSKKIIKKVGLITCCVSLGLITSIMLPPVKVYADALQLQKLSTDSPELFDKVIQVTKMYIEYISKADISHSINLFMDMICTCLDGSDKELFIQASRGVDIHEILRIISFPLIYVK